MNYDRRMIENAKVRNLNEHKKMKPNRQEFKGLFILLWSKIKKRFEKKLIIVK